MVFFPPVPYFAVTLPRHGVSVTPLDDRLLAVSYFSSIHARHRETKIHVHCRRPGDVHTEAQGTVRAPRLLPECMCAVMIQKSPTGDRGSTTSTGQNF